MDSYKTFAFSPDESKDLKTELITMISDLTIFGMITQADEEALAELRAQAIIDLSDQFDEEPHEILVECQQKSMETFEEMNLDTQEGAENFYQYFVDKYEQTKALH